MPRAKAPPTSTQVYDSLGIACQFNLTAVLESSNSTATTYRWFADSPDNQLASGAPNIAVGTGLIKFDGNGNFIGATQDHGFHLPQQRRLQFAAAVQIGFQLSFRTGGDTDLA